MFSSNCVHRHRPTVHQLEREITWNTTVLTAGVHGRPNKRPGGRAREILTGLFKRLPPPSPRSITPCHATFDIGGRINITNEKRWTTIWFIPKSQRPASRFQSPPSTASYRHRFSSLCWAGPAVASAVIGWVGGRSVTHSFLKAKEGEGEVTFLQSAVAVAVAVERTS